MTPSSTRSAAPLVPRGELAKHVQVVLTNRSDLTVGRDFAVASPSTWRLADLSTKYAFLKDCVGWGGMPLHMVEKDIAAGTLVVLDVDEMPRMSSKRYGLLFTHGLSGFCAFT